MVFLLLGHGHASAQVTLLEPGDDVEAAINAAQPGDEIVLAGGSYELTERFGISVHGTADASIVVRAADGETPHLHRAANDQNVIDVDDAEHLVLRGIEISGGSHGLRLVNARFVSVEQCEIHDTGDVALSANSGGEYEGLRILHNHIHHTNNTGEGMYLGCNEDGCRMFDSLIEGNHVHHTNGPTVEQGDGIEIKEGSYNNVVRDNVIHDTRYPCILTYSTAGNGAPNVIERNVLWNCGDHAIQSAADAIIRNNVILGANADGIAMQPHQSGAPGNLMVVHNTVLHATNDAISISGIVGSVVIANNALYALQGNAISASGELAQLLIAGNVGQGSVTPASSGFAAAGSLADDFVGASFSGAPPNDVFPKPGSALVAAGDTDHVAGDDFNGTPRNGVADVGAYAFDAAGNPGWTLGPGFKSATPAAEDLDAGSSGATGGAGAGGSTAEIDGGMQAPGTGGSGARDAGGSDAAEDVPEGGAQESASSSDASGCGCRVVSSRSAARGGYVLLLLAAAWLARARRRRMAGTATVLGVVCAAIAVASGCGGAETSSGRAAGTAAQGGSAAGAGEAARGSDPAGSGGQDAAVAAGSGGSAANAGSGGTSGAAGSVNDAGPPLGQDGGEDGGEPQASPGCGSPVTVGMTTETLEVGGDARSYLVVVPVALDGLTPAPVLLGFHGGNGTSQYASQTYGLTGDHPALYVYPQAISWPEAGGVAWNVDPGGHDLPYFDALLADLAAKYCVDAGRVFAAGQSNGGFFVNALACYRPDALRAIAAVAGGGPPSQCTKGMTVMLVHGTADTSVTIDKGMYSRDYWLEANGCAGASSSPVEPAPCVAYSGCAQPVLWCEHGGGHAWPDFAGAAIREFFFSL